MMALKPQKPICSSEDDFKRDRLSELPDDVILHILSSMPITDAVRTVLLRRFGNLWTLVPTLKFDMRSLFKNKSFWQRGQVYCFVRNVLMLYQNLSVDRFHLLIEYNFHSETKKDVDDITMWLRFALDRQAKEIRVSDKFYCYGFNKASIPKLTSEFLVTLDLAYFEIEKEFQVKLTSLKKLLLHHVRIRDEILQRFISGCPTLQELVIVNPVKMTKLSVSAPNIDKLSLVLTDVYQWTKPLSLYLRNIKSLYLDIDYADRIDIIDVSLVRDIHIKYCSFYMYHNSYNELTVNKMFFQKLIGTEVFRLSRDPSRVFLYTIQKLRLLQCKWKRVILELSDFCKTRLLGLYHLMRSLKHLEELVIYTTEEFKVSTNLLGVEFPAPYGTPQLKTITLRGYWKSWKSQLQLIECLLKGATALDKLVIVLMKRQLEEAQELEFVKHVSSFPKASPSARVIFA